MGMATGRTVRFAAITSSLEWSFRQTCSHGEFRMEVARKYMAEHTDHNLKLMERAAEMGAELVLGPEYFCGSELFLTTEENRALLVEPPDGPTSQRLSQLARARGVYLAACYNVEHSGAIAQTCLLLGRGGELVGTHVKHNSIPPGSALEKHLELFELDIGRTGILICADVTGEPEHGFTMARRGMQTLLVPGVGFAGQHWRHFIIVRAIDLKCAVVYADSDRAMIVDRRGEVLAETAAADEVIVADVEMTAEPWGS